MSAKLVKVTVDDREVEVPDGVLVLKAAEALGIVVPHFCYHDRLKPIAACRLCLVEIEGMRGLQPSCATSVKEGMIVRTQVAAALESHKEVLDLVLENHPLDCPKCEAAGRCRLQDFTYEFGPHRVSNYKPPGISGFDYQEVPWSPLLAFDPWKCVECMRCIRVCDEVHDCRALTTEARGHQMTITTFANGPLHCDFCGSCASVCPTGAIEQQPGRFFKKDWEYEKRPTVCTHCGHGCTLIARTCDERIAKIDDDMNVGINGANLCAKGRFGFDMQDVAERVRTPLVRDGDSLREATWDEALQVAGDLVEEAQSSGRRIAGLASGTLSVEDLQAFGMVLDSLKAPRLTESRDGDVTRRLAARTGSQSATGVFGSTVEYADIAAGGDGVSVRDRDLANESDSVRNGFARIAVVDADLEALDYVAHLEVARAARLSGRTVVSLGSAYARLKPYVYEELPLSVESVAAQPEGTLWIVNAESVPEDILDAIAERLVNGASSGDGTSSGDGLLLVAAQSNARAFGPLGFATATRFVADLLLVAGPMDDGATKEITAGLSPGARLIVSAHYRGGITDRADVVFPAALAYEKPGTYINSEGRSQFAAAVARPQGVAWPDGATWSRLARKIGAPIPETPQELLAAACAAAPALAGGPRLEQRGHPGAPGAMPAVSPMPATVTRPAAASLPAVASLPASRLAPADKHTGLLLTHSAWTATLTRHLAASRDFSPWSE